MNWTEIIIEAIPGIGMLLGLIYAFGRWSVKIDANTKATEDLTSAFNDSTNRTHDRLEGHEVKLENHEVRLHVLEKDK